MINKEIEAKLVKALENGTRVRIYAGAWEFNGKPVSETQFYVQSIPEMQVRVRGDKLVRLMTRRIDNWEVIWRKEMHAGKFPIIEEITNQIMLSKIDYVEEVSFQDN